MCKDTQVLGALLELSDNTNPDFIEIMGYAVTHTDDIEFINGVYNKFTEINQRRIKYDQFAYLAVLSNLDVIRWVHDLRGYELPANMLDVAARMGNVALVQFLHEHVRHGCLNLALGYAAEFGHLDIIKFLHENRTEATDSATCKHEYAVSRLQDRPQAT